MRGLAAQCSDALFAQIGAAEQNLQSRPLRDEHVHSARKSIKKARAALRLMRESLGDCVYKKENEALRDAARGLAALRDAKSLSEAWEALRDRHPANFEGTGFDILSRTLRKNLAARHDALMRAPASLQQCVATLTSCRMRLAKRGTAQQDDQTARGLRLIFRAGRRALGRAEIAQTPEVLHEWRKHVKYLSNALKMIDGETMHWRKLVMRTDKLADQLGEDHDLAELGRYVRDLKLPRLQADDCTSLSMLIERRRKTLQKRAFKLGKSIYALKPKNFVRTLLENTSGARD